SRTARSQTTSRSRSRSWRPPARRRRRGRRPSSLARGVEDVHTPEECDRRAVAHRRDLSRLALSTGEGTVELPCAVAADRLQRAPEVGGGRLVGHVAQHAGEPSGPDRVEALTGELEVVALLVDRPALVTLDVDAV